MTEASEKDEPNDSTSGLAGDSELERAFRSRVNQIFGSKRRSVEMAIGEAFELWLAWRGDPAYLVAAVGKKPERELAWRIVRYTQIPELAARYDEIDASSLNGPFPDHILAFLVRFVSAELDRSRGAQALSEGPKALSSEIHPERISADLVFGRLKRGEMVIARWPSLKAPTLSRKTITLAVDRIECSEYPGLDSPDNRKPVGLTRFLEKSEKKNRARWVVSRG